MATVSIKPTCRRPKPAVPRGRGPDRRRTSCRTLDPRGWPILEAFVRVGHRVADMGAALLRHHQQRRQEKDTTPRAQQLDSAWPGGGWLGDHAAREWEDLRPRE